MILLYFGLTDFTCQLEKDDDCDIVSLKHIVAIIFIFLVYGVNILACELF